MTERLHFHFSFHALEKEMATHSGVLGDYNSKWALFREVAGIRGSVRSLIVDYMLFHLLHKYLFAAGVGVPY